MKLSFLMAISFLIFLIALFAGPNMIDPFHMNEVEKEILLSIRLPASWSQPLWVRRSELRERFSRVS